jgi:competence protein ComEC
MPLGALAVLAMPFRLEEWPLKAMGFGIDQMLGVAHWTSDLPGAVSYLTAWPPIALVLMVLGGLWLCLWRTPWRIAGVVVSLLGLAIALLAPAPDAFIGEEGDKLAFRVRSKGEWQYGLLGVKPTSFRGEAWLKRLGADPVKPLAGSSLVRCDALGCILPFADGREISLVRDGRAIAEECASSKVLVSVLRIEQPCDGPMIVLDWPKIRDGAVAVRFGGRAPHTQMPPRGHRPWQHSAFAHD